jgi:hypothetical protein
MLHIVTPLYRYDLLEKVYQSIPKHADITWHIAKTSRREKLTHQFLISDQRVKLYEIDCADDDMVTKRNVVFAAIKDGYFYLLDDDTVFLDTLYAVYQQYSRANFVGMIIGHSNLVRAGYPILKATQPRFDTGMVLSHHSVLRVVAWEWHPTFPRDFYFWSRCFSFYGKDAAVLIDKVISQYNYFGALYTIKKRVLGFNIDFKIYSVLLAKLYFFMADVKFLIKNMLHRWFKRAKL